MPNLLHANAVRNVLHCDARGFAGLIPHQVVTPEREPALRIPDPLLDQREVLRIILVLPGEPVQLVDPAPDVVDVRERVYGWIERNLHDFPPLR